MRTLPFWCALPFLGATLFVAGCGDSVEAKSSDGTAIWSKRLGRASNLEPARVAVDAAGNVLVAGRFYGTVDLGAGPIESPANNYQLFLVKYSQGGAYLWSKTFGDYLGEAFAGVGFDGKGNIVLAANVAGNVDFGGGALAASGNGDVAIVKLDESGNHVFSEIFGDGSYQSASSLSVSPSGEMVIGGTFNGTLDFGGGPLEKGEYGGMFVVKLDANGKHVFSRGYDAGYYNYGVNAAIADDGSIVMTGTFGPTIDLGGGPLASPEGDSDIYVAKLDPSGSHVWSKRYGGYNYDTGSAIAIDADGSLLVTGAISGSVDLGGGFLTGNDEWTSDPFILKLDASGNHIWSRRFRGDGSQYASAISTGASGEVLVTGAFSSAIDLGQGEVLSSGTDPADPYGYNYAEDGFVVRMDRSGAVTWVKTFGNDLAQEGSSIAVDSLGSVILGGTGLGTFDLGDGDVKGSGYFDFFVAKLAP